MDKGVFSPEEQSEQGMGKEAGAGMGLGDWRSAAQ